jgi:short-subunit dehydrogenase
LTGKKILITGATGAIGGALARCYAAPNVELHLHGRNQETLNGLIRECELSGARVIGHRMDLRGTDAVFEWCRDLSSPEAFDLVIINAGMNTHVSANGAPEPFDEVMSLLDLNIKATMAMVQGILPAMQARGAGQIALISSLAGYFGLPMTPSYSASKAAVKAYGEGLRGWLGPEGIRVNVVMPGYVASPMCDAMPGPKMFLWSPDKAARVIKDGLAKDKARISFPFPLNLGTWFLAVLPAALSIRILRWIGYRG